MTTEPLFLPVLVAPSSIHQQLSQTWVSYKTLALLHGSRLEYY